MSQLAVWLAESERAAGALVRRLAAARLIQRQPLFVGEPPLIWLTSRGASEISSPMPTGRPSLSEVRHDLGAAWLWLAAQRGAFGPVGAVHSERAIRSHDAQLTRAGGGRPLSVGLGSYGPAGRPARHVPDVLLEAADGRWIALELELTRKGRPALDRVMRAYATDGRIDKVLYLVSDPRIARTISDAAARAGIGRLVQVDRISPDGIVGAPRLGARAVARGPAARSRRSPAAAPRAAPELAP